MDFRPFPFFRPGDSPVYSALWRSLPRYSALLGQVRVRVREGASRLQSGLVENRLQLEARVGIDRISLSVRGDYSRFPPHFNYCRLLHRRLPHMRLLDLLLDLRLEQSDPGSYH